MNSNKYKYVLQQADNSLILGQRLAEWCGHGPVLEQDIAMTNISLDLIGQARLFYQYAAELEGQNRTEDDLAYHRDAWDFRNTLLVEQPNGDFAETIVRQFFYDTFSSLYYRELIKSTDLHLSSIAEKSLKESNYHVKWSSDWLLRLGDGTQESHDRAQKALNKFWGFRKELAKVSDVDKIASDEGYGPDLKNIEAEREIKIVEIIKEATLTIPKNDYYHTGGKDGKHTEHLGYILADLQFLQRAYPGNEW